LILFRDPNDQETYDRYKSIVQKELMGEKSSINFLVADGFKFSHPLYHLGKKSDDLPVLAIDSFRHMYVFPKDTKEFIDKPGELKSFIADLHSGKLHREFHHGPEKPQKQEQDTSKGLHIPKDKPENVPESTNPPESTFRKLAPSHNRYTILKDEL